MPTFIDIYDEVTQKSHTTCLWLKFFSDILWRDLGLDLFKYDLVRMQYFPETYISTLGKFQPFATRLTNKRTQNVKTLHFALWPDLIWHVTLFCKF